VRGESFEDRPDRTVLLLRSELGRGHSVRRILRVQLFDFPYPAFSLSGFICYASYDDPVATATYLRVDVHACIPYGCMLHVAEYPDPWVV